MNLGISDEPFQSEIFFSEGSSYFDVWPGFTDGKFPGLTNTLGLRLVLERFDVVVFRGTLQHRGAAFPGFNVRVHMYWKSDKVISKTDSSVWVRCS